MADGMIQETTITCLPVKIGTDFVMNIKFNNLDITGLTFKSQILDVKAPDRPVVGEFVITPDEVTDSISMLLPRDVTATLTPNEYKGDILIISDIARSYINLIVPVIYGFTQYE